MPVKEKGTPIDNTRLGNAFLSNISAVDGIFHLCRAFEDSEVVHVELTIDPVRDLEIIHEELRLKDQEYIDKMVQNAAKDVGRIGKGGDAKGKELKDQYEIMLKLQKLVCIDKKDARTGDWNSAKEIELVNSCFLLTAKPVIYLMNLSERDYCRYIHSNLLQKKEQVASKSQGLDR